MARESHYNQVHMQKELIEYWAFFKNEEKFFYYNPSSDMYYLGIQKKENLTDCPCILYPMRFFIEENERIDQSNLHNGIAFEYYWIIKKGKNIYKNLTVTPKKNVIKKIQHVYTKKTDNYKAWETLFTIISQKIKAKELLKVVASTKVEFICESKVNIESILLNLLEKNTESFVFAYHKNGETFLGASPEVLVEKKGTDIMSYALAGTIAKTEKNKAEQGLKLQHDAKNNHEHRIVVESIAKVMQSITGTVTINDTKLMELRNIFHLKTSISTKDDTFTLLDWVKHLHPTPAMAGEPRELAMQIIREHEKHERGMYAAPFGIIDANGDGVFVVGIRAGLIIGNTIYAYAGCGIVEQSDCDEEYEELNNKLRTIIECL